MKRVPLIHIIIATGFGSGFSPFAPGTAGALLATLIWLALSCAVSPTLLLIIWGEDPSRVVVDEMVGVWIPLLAAPAGNLWYALAAFALFRLFDIFKPLGIRKMEYLKGGVGVMMDDILAGIYSLILLIVARWLIG